MYLAGFRPFFLAKSEETTHEQKSVSSQSKFREWVQTIAGFVFPGNLKKSTDHSPPGQARTHGPLSSRASKNIAVATKSLLQGKQERTGHSPPGQARRFPGPHRPLRHTQARHPRHQPLRQAKNLGLGIRKEKDKGEKGVEYI